MGTVTDIGRYIALGPPPNSTSGGQGSLTMNIQLQNLNADYSSERNQALTTLGVGALLMLGGGITGKTGVFVVGLIVALFGYARYQSALSIGAARDALGAQFVAGAEVKV